MRTRTKALLGIAIALVLLLVVAYFGMGFVIYDKLGNVKGDCDEHLANRPDNFALYPDWPADFDVTPYFMTGSEAVRFPSREPGIEVAGWWIPKDPDAPAVILVDGLGGCKNSIAVLAPAGMLWRNGFNVLLIDLRDTGDSTFEDGRTTIGNDELQDVLGAWDWLVKQKGFDPRRIGLFANSLGGATAVYAFSEEPRMAALFLQSTFGNLQQIIAAELTRNGYPALLSPSALVMGSVVTGANLFARNPSTEIAKASGRPVYLVHTHADTRIDVNQSEQLAAAAEAAGVNVTTWFPENGEHVRTPAVYPEEFEQRLVEFFREALAPKVSAPNEMHWDTNGGGQITFDISPNGANYDVAVSSYQFEDRDHRFTITAESGAVYRVLSAVMQDPGNIRLHTTNEPRGSWTTLRFAEGADSGTYEDVIVDGDLSIIYDYVIAQIKAGQT